MDVKEQKEQNMQDEISIIDLLAILLRYKMDSYCYYFIKYYYFYFVL